MSANISIISLFCKQMREKRGLSYGPSTKKNEENEASPPTPPRRGRGVKCLEDRVQIEYNWRTYHSPPWRTNGRCSLSELNGESKGAGGEASFLFTFFLIFNTFLYDQIEMKTCFLCLCEAISWLWCPYFYYLAL